jgi:uncharacterized protein (TIGR00725 family)
VIGKGRDCPGPVAELAHATGVALAALHPAAVLVCGGLGGVMDAAALGMTAGGGVAIGLLPDPPSPSSPNLTYAIRTGLASRARDVLVAEAADLVFALPGSHGTLIEGWAAADRGVPLIGVGDHAGWPTAGLAFTASGVAPGDCAGVALALLDLPGVG